MRRTKAPTSRNWHRPLPAMISAFTTAGFRISAIDEPLPAPGTPHELLTDFLQHKPPGSGFPCFMFFVLEADQRPACLMPRLGREMPVHSPVGRVS